MHCPRTKSDHQHVLLGACGINDLSWWTILGDLLDFHRSTAKILGIGLGTNVAGVLIGEFIGAFSDAPGPAGRSSYKRFP
jgi:hypothetical protein